MAGLPGFEIQIFCVFVWLNRSCFVGTAFIEDEDIIIMRFEIKCPPAIKETLYADRQSLEILLLITHKTLVFFFFNS